MSSFCSWVARSFDERDHARYHDHHHYHHPHAHLVPMFPLSHGYLPVQYNFQQPVNYLPPIYGTNTVNMFAPSSVMMANQPPSMQIGGSNSFPMANSVPNNTMQTTFPAIAQAPNHISAPSAPAPTTQPALSVTGKNRSNGEETDRLMEKIHKSFNNGKVPVTVIKNQPNNVEVSQVIVFDDEGIMELNSPLRAPCRCRCCANERRKRRYLQDLTSERLGDRCGCGSCYHHNRSYSHSYDDGCANSNYVRDYVDKDGNDSEQLITTTRTRKKVSKKY